jgi:hypothetical protein|tara:strand:- start:305 stop:745 length:441 start_codon:yes stop_codon:yes gene_type:complete
MSHWLHKGKILEEAPEGYFGFVYAITNIKSGKKYIGRKYFGTTRRTKVVGKKRRKVTRKDSNWREYTGSSVELNKDINKLGKLHFRFEILILGSTKGQVNYLEENIHHRYHVASNDAYYNDCIGPRRFGNVKVDIAIKKILTEIVG